MDWLLAHWADVEKLTGEKSIEDYPRVTANVIVTEVEAQKFYDFFDKKADDPILARTIKVAHAGIDARLGLIKTFKDKVVGRLQDLMKGA